MINTIKFHFKKDAKNSEFYYFVIDNKLALIIESVILLLASVVFYIVSKFHLVMVIPLVLSIINGFVVFTTIRKSQTEIKKKTMAYQIEYSINEVFLELKILTNIMKEKEFPESDIGRWKKYYVSRIIETKTINTITDVMKDIKVHFYRITLMEFPTLKEKDVLNFVKKESETWWNELYPNFKADLKNRAFSKQKPLKNTSGPEPINQIQSTNYRLEKNLKILGLPTTMRDFNIVRKRYYDLVKLYHPDSKNNKGEDIKFMQEKIIEINGAYQEIEKMLKQMEANNNEK